MFEPVRCPDCGEAISISMKFNGGKDVERRVHCRCGTPLTIINMGDRKIVQDEETTIADDAKGATP